MGDAENLAPTPDAPDSTKQVVKNSALLSALNVVVYASALLTDIMAARYFGLGRETDAFFIAFTIPQLIATILLVSVDVSLVPLFSSTLIEEGRARLWRFSSNLTNLSLLFFGAVGLAGSLASPWLVQVMGAGLPEATRSLSNSLSAWLFISVIPLGAIEVLKATLFSLRSFAFPAASAVLANLTIFLFIIFGNSTLGIYSLAVGEVVSVVLQFAMLGIVLRAKGFRYRPVLTVREKQTMTAIRQLRESMAGGGLTQIIVVLERFLGSFLPVGVVSAISYARRILRAITNVFIGGISTALLPRMSAQFARTHMGGYRQSINLGVKLTAIIALPVTAGVVATSLLIVQLFFQRGNFDQASAEITARLLGIYILSTPFIALMGFFITSFFATQDTRTPLIMRTATLALDVCLYAVLFALFGAEGMALAFVLSRIVITTIVMWLAHHRFGFVEAGLLAFLAKSILAALVMWLVVAWALNVLLAQLPTGLPLIVEALIKAAAGLGAYVLILFVTRVDELWQVASLIQKRFGLRLGARL